MIDISVIIPAYNEQSYLPRLLDSIEQARALYTSGSDAIEVIVADNSSTDTTALIAHERGCRVTHVEMRSIAAARNGGAAVASGKVLCFVDADFVIHPESFNTIGLLMEAGDCCGGATGGIMERSSIGLHVTEMFMTAITRLAGVNWGIIFCRADVFQQVGGYNEEKMYAEDVEFFRAMRKCGTNNGQKTILQTKTPATVSTRKFDRHGDWHMFRMWLWVPFRYGSYKAWVHAYWYDDNERF